MTTPRWEDRAERHLAHHYGETVADPRPDDDEDRPCCLLAATPGAGHALNCPRHDAATCPACARGGGG